MNSVVFEINGIISMPTTPPILWVKQNFTSGVVGFLTFILFSMTPFFFQINIVTFTHRMSDYQKSKAFAHAARFVNLQRIL